MKTTTKTPDLFGSLLAALCAAYETELARLADIYRPRILAGEFSGNTGVDGDRRGPEQGDPCHLRLERELGGSHPWLATQRGRLAVEAASKWITSNFVSGETGAPENELGDCAAECMAHDVLSVAAERGWVKRYKDAQPYTLRVA
jgi:hypothetical protein